VLKWLRTCFGGGKKSPTVTATLSKELGHVHVIRIGGILNKATIDNLQAVAARDLAAGTRSLKLLIILQDFLGWKRGDDWADIEFFAKHGQQIERIAVVGDRKWETESLMFLAAGHRKGEVRYFAPDQETNARAWLVH
jgi:hypothetical protein